MNVETGHLVHDIAQVTEEAERAKYQLVPLHLRGAAVQELQAKAEVYIDLSANTPLAQWARKRQRKAEAKRERQVDRR